MAAVVRLRPECKKEIKSPACCPEPQKMEKYSSPGMLVLVALWFLARLVASTTLIDSIAIDQAALLAMRTHMSPDSQNSLAGNWSDGISVCNWFGITCGGQSGRVIALNLSSMDLHGTIAPHIGNLSSLEMLDLGFNMFSGGIPLQLWNLTMLRELYLGHNNLEGPIPEEIGHLLNLKNLSISSNHLTGQIPSSIGNCTLLRDINLGDNNFSGPIPSEIGNLPNLQVFKVDNNILNGLIPPTIFNISTIQVINLRLNHLSGSLVPSLGLFLPNLVELLLQGNELHGEIPISISNSSSLSSLDLSNNLFTGSNLNMLGGLRGLQKLDLANNYLTNGPPAPESNFISSLANCRQLKRLVLSGNSLNTNLPSSIVNLSTSLEQLIAKDCKLKGHIPTEVGNLSSLIGLELGNNGLIGSIPGTIGKLEKLQVLRLQNNRLQGNMSNNLCNLNSLAELLLGGNEISGSVPECLGNLGSLRILDLSSNRFTSGIPLDLFLLRGIMVINMSSNSLDGPLPEEIGGLRASEIDFSNNQLSGEIPASIGNLWSLLHLSLAKNRLNGSIPLSLSNCSGLEFLDLSRNNLSGAIPKSLERLRGLVYFNVSVNSFEGEVPSGGPFQNFTAESYLRNKALCGAPELHFPRCKTVAQRRSVRSVPYLKILLPLASPFYLFLVCYLLLKCWKTEQDPLVTTDRQISYQEIMLATDGFSENNLLGAGSSATVYKGALREEKNVAIKVFHVQSDRGLRSFEVEYKVMQITRHRNVVKLINSCRTTDFRALVLEHVPNGGLDNWLHRHNHFLNFLQRLDIMIDVAIAVNHLHSNLIIHCDLKPANILLDEDMGARVSDFSISMILGEKNATGQTTTLGTFGYMAPEYGSNGIVSEKTDVYSFGITLLETFARKKPTDEMFDAEMNLKSWVFGSLPDAVDKVVDVTLLQTDQEEMAPKMKCLLSIMKLAYLCTSELPSERISVTGILDQLRTIKARFVRLTGL